MVRTLTLRRGVQLLSERGEHGSRECITTLPDVNQLLDLFLYIEKEKHVSDMAFHKIVSITKPSDDLSKVHHVQGRVIGPQKPRHGWDVHV